MHKESQRIVQDKLSYFIFQVSILVEDVNDESPEFQFTVYKGQIEENLAPGSSVLDVKAIDNDEQDMVRFFDGKNFFESPSFYSW